MNDLHAKRVLPGYDENAKLQLLQNSKTRRKSSFALTKAISSATRCAATTGSPTIWRCSA